MKPGKHNFMVRLDPPAEASVDGSAAKQREDPPKALSPLEMQT